MQITRRDLFRLSGFALLAGVEPDDVERRAAEIIRGYDREGWHRTATAVDRKSADRLMTLARGLGGQPQLQPFDVSRVDPGDAFVDIDGRKISGLPMFDGSFTTGDGVSGVLGAVANVQSDHPIAWLRIGPNAEAELTRTRRASSARRALIVVTTGQHPGLCPVNAASFTAPFGPPVLQVSSEHLATIERAAGRGATVRVAAPATRTRATAFNVAADVRGSNDTLAPVCVMTPRSGWYFNASERGGGLVCWLEALRACAARRPLRSVQFVASSGHELGHLGLHAYLARHPALAREASVWVHFGASIGASTGDTRLTSSNDGLESVALRALASQGLEGLPRSPASQVGGEAATINRAGGRFLSFIGGNAWFHNPRDRWPEAVDVAKVARFARAAADLTLALANAPAE